MDFKQQLQENGYVVIPNILSHDKVEHALRLFHNWKSTIENFDTIHSKISPHGIIKTWGIGQQQHAWFIRTQPEVQQIFKDFYETDDLIVSYDGSCYITHDLYKKKKDNCWTHTDQAPCKPGFECLQGFISLTSNTNTSLVVYEGSHKLHESYFKSKDICNKSNWNKIDPTYLDEIKDTKKILNVEAGSLVLWDSRTFHQNQYGSPNCENRIVQYVCYLPRSHKKNTKAVTKKRQLYFDTMRTTSHWPCPVYVNGLQPRTWGDDSLVINYDSLVKSDLTPYIEDIIKLI